MVAQELKNLYQYRGYIYSSVRREFALKYKNSLLGIAWLIIPPTALIAVYTLVFSQIMRVRIPGDGGFYSFGIFLCSGLLTWTLFINIVTRSQTMFCENANLIKKLNFPKLCIPAIVVLTAMMEFVIIFGIFMVFLLLLGEFPGLAILAMIPCLALQVILATGIGLIAGTMNVFFKDTGQAFGVITQLWFWVTPIIYPISILPKWAEEVVLFNPVTPIVMFYQSILVNGVILGWASLWWPLVLTAIITVISAKLYRSKNNEMVDEL